MKDPETNISSKCTFQVLHLSFWSTISEQISEPIKVSLDSSIITGNSVFQSRFCVKSDNENVKLNYSKWHIHSPKPRQITIAGFIQNYFKNYFINYSKLISECNHLKAFLERAARVSFFLVKDAKEDNDHYKTEVMKPFTQTVSFSFFLCFKNISPIFSF